MPPFYLIQTPANLMRLSNFCLYLCCLPEGFEEFSPLAFRPSSRGLLSPPVQALFVDGRFNVGVETRYNALPNWLVSLVVTALSSPPLIAQASTGVLSREHRLGWYASGDHFAVRKTFFSLKMEETFGCCVQVTPVDLSLVCSFFSALFVMEDSLWRA